MVGCAFSNSGRHVCKRLFCSKSDCYKDVSIDEEYKISVRCCMHTIYLCHRSQTLCVCVFLSDAILFCK